jgi:hypothetical protein
VAVGSVDGHRKRDAMTFRQHGKFLSGERMQIELEPTAKGR